CVTALGDSVAQAQRLAYRVVEQVAWAGALYRRDIGYRAVAREQAQEQQP
ncbi:MAG: phosphoribosylglycinamide synthetase C domain-containing protein, partial [Immundisolibacter sp.]